MSNKSKKTTRRMQKLEFQPKKKTSRTRKPSVDLFKGTPPSPPPDKKEKD